MFGCGVLELVWGWEVDTCGAGSVETSTVERCTALQPEPRQEHIY